MKQLVKIFSLLSLMVLTACQTVPMRYSSTNTPEEIASIATCNDLAANLNELDAYIQSQSGGSQTGTLMQDTAVSAAQTGLAQSGAYGSAGPFAGLGMNFLRGLYSINAAEQRQKTVSLAHGNKVLLLEAYEMKACP